MIAVRLLLSVFCGISLSAFAGGGAPPVTFVKADGNLDVARVVEHFEDLYRSDTSTALAELTVVRPRRERTLTMRSWSKGREQALIQVLAPPREAGVATLKVEKNLWNYLPRVRRTIRIPPSMMLSPWMGSDFTNDDLVRESSYADDYTYELVGKSADPEGWTIRFTAKEGVVGLWSRFDLVVSPDGLLPLTSNWYNRKDELARTLTWDMVRTVGERQLPARMTLVPRDRDDGEHRTIMVYKEIEFDVELPEGTFSLSRLERQH